MGIKISELPQNTLPYRGSEEFPLVQGIETRSGTLSSLVSYLSGDFAFVNRSNEFTKSQAISGNLTVTGEISATVFNAVSANFTVIDIRQYELSGFGVTGDVNITGDLNTEGDINVQGRGIIDTATTEDALRVTQRGTGMALRIEDTTNVDSTPFVITSTGRVGIGTSEPSAPLQVKATGSDNPTVNGLLVYNDSNAEGQHAIIGVRSAGVDGGDAFISFDSATEIGWSAGLDNSDGNKFKISNLWNNLSAMTRLTIDSVGNIGIGTPNPNEKLTVIGNVSATDGLITSGIGVVDTNTTQDALRVTQRGTGLALRIEDDANVDSTPFVVTSTGNVGAGTTAPNEKLTVIGNISATSGIVTSGISVVDTNTTQDALRVTQRGTGLAIRVEDDSNVDSSPFAVTATGTVGIGTELPNEKLTVIGNISATGIITTSNAGVIDTNTSQAALRVTQRGTGLALRIEDDTNVDTTPFVVTSTGTVGVGTELPNEKLTVIGNISATSGLITSGIGVIDTNTTQDALRVTQRGTGNALRVEDIDNVDSTPFVITSTGSVGIGTELPSEKLTVIGNISATGSITTSNFSVIDTDTAQDALRITQRGTGMALRVEDETNVDSTPFAITSSGTVGIGTDAPNEKLTVIGNISATSGIITSGTGIIDTSSPLAALRVTQRGTGNALIVEDETTPDSTSFVITSAGNVGIGANNPTEKLYVNGAIYLGGATTSLSSVGSQTDPQQNVDESNRTNTYAVLGPAGGGNEWAYLRQIGSSELQTITLDFHDDVNSATVGSAFAIRKVASYGFNPDQITTSFYIDGLNNIGVSTTTPNERLTVVGNTSATGVAYTRELDFGSSERPSLTGIKQALNSFLYVAPALSYVRVNGSSSASLEVGQALTTPAITWTSNKVEAAAVSNYLLTLPTGITSTGSNTFTFSGFNDTNTYNITTLPGTDTQATSAWSVRVTDWANAQSTSSVTATWRYRVYYGATSQVTPTDAQVRAGTEADTLATSRTGLGSRTVTPNNEYMYVAYPSRFGATSQFRVNGLPNTAFTLVTINNFTNAYGGTAQYFVYRSDNLLTGTYTIEII